MDQRSIHDIRAEIADLQSQRAQLADAPLPRATVRDRARAALTAAAAEESAVLQRALKFPDRNGGLRLRAPVVNWNGDRADITGILAAVLGPDTLIKALEPHIKALPDGPTDAQRADGLAEFDARILELEHAEEDLIEAFEESGAGMGRRPDASPAVVLRVKAQA